MNKFFKNSLDFEFEFMKLGKTRIKTAIKKIVGIICSNPID